MPVDWQLAYSVWTGLFLFLFLGLTRKGVRQTEYYSSRSIFTINLLIFKQRYPQTTIQLTSFLTWQISYPQQGSRVMAISVVVYWLCTYQDPIQLISLLQLMSTENIQEQHPTQPAPEHPPPITQNQELLEEIRNLKKVVSALAQKESFKQRETPLLEAPIAIIMEDNNPESEMLQSKLQRTSSKQAKLHRGDDIYRNVKHDWKVRITSRQKASSQLANNHQQHPKKADESSLNLISENQEERANLDESIINKHLSFLNSRSDTDEEQPAKTQLFAPSAKSNPNSTSNEFRFKKINLIPAIENEHNRFRSYITSQRRNVPNNRAINSRQSSLGANSNNRISASQQDLPKRKSAIQSRQTKMVQELRRIQITRETPKEQLIQSGKKLFTLFYEAYSPEITFNIKKYKNCLVFSLMPAITKAIILHYAGDVYFGNVSLDQKGRIEKNGLGIQIIKQRHFYEGHFINGKKNGRGRIVYETGDIYDGQWHEGEIYGFGRYTEGKSDRVYEGFWKRGQYCGQKTAKQSVPFQFF